MCLKAQAYAAATGTQMECHQGWTEQIPLPDATSISNGVINLSFRKRKVIKELFHVIKPGGPVFHHGHRQRKAIVAINHE